LGSPGLPGGRNRSALETGGIVDLGTSGQGSSANSGQGSSSGAHRRSSFRWQRLLHLHKSRSHHDLASTATAASGGHGRPSSHGRLGAPPMERIVSDNSSHGSSGSSGERHFSQPPDSADGAPPQELPAAAAAAKRPSLFRGLSFGTVAKPVEATARPEPLSFS
jgi:hypothetical protein